MTTAPRSNDRTDALGERERVYSGSSAFGAPATLKSFTAWARERPDYFAGQSPFSTEKLRVPYRQVAWAYAAVDRIASAYRAPILRFRENADPDAPDLPSDHPLVRLFARPYPGLAPRNLATAFAQYLQLDGEALLVGLDSRNRWVQTYGHPGDELLELPERLFVFRGGEGRLELDIEGGYPRQWRMQAARGQTTIPYGATALVRYDDPDRSFRGMGPMQAAWGAAESLYLATLLNQRIVGRGGEKEGYLEVEGDISAEEFERVRQQIREDWDKAQQRGSTRILANGAKFVPTGQSSKDLLFDKLINLTRGDVGAAFQVPDALLGSDVSNYATFHGFRRMFWELKIVPDLALVSDTIATELISRLRDSRLRSVVPYFDTSGVRALSEDLGGQIESVRGLQDVGVPLATAVSVIGLEGLDTKDIEGADVPLIRSGLVPLTAAVAGLGSSGSGADVDSSGGGSDGEPTPVGEGDQTGEEPNTEPQQNAATGRRRSATATDTPEDELREWYGKREERRTSGDNRIASDVRKVWRKSREAQLKHLANLAAQDPTKSLPTHGGVYCRGVEDVQPGLLDQVGAAWEADRRERSALDDSDPRLTTVVRGCCGERLFSIPRAITTARSAVFERHHEAVIHAGGMQRLQDLVLLRALDLTEQEIDEMIVLQQAKWSEEMAEALGDTFLGIYEGQLKELAAETGLEVIETVSPAKLRALKEAGVTLANDVNGTLAKRVRSALIQTLSENQDATGPLRTRVRELLGPLEDATREQFNQADRRALTIARTETAFVDNRATYDQHVAWAEQGRMLTHEWVAKEPLSPPGRTREGHAALHATKVRVGEPWISPTTQAMLFFPGDKSSNVPAAFVNCRCGLKPRRLSLDVADGLLSQDEADDLATSAP